MIVVDASFAQSSEHTEDDEHDHGHGGSDPHLWLGIKGARAQAENIKMPLLWQIRAQAFMSKTLAVPPSLTAFTTSLRKIQFLEKEFCYRTYGFWVFVHDFGLEQKALWTYMPRAASARQLARLNGILQG